MKLFTKHLTAVLLVALWFAAAPGQVIAEEIESPRLDSLEQLYRQRITHLNLEILNETQRRTTILGQLDAMINDISDLEKQKITTQDSTPVLTDTLQEVTEQVLFTEKKIEFNKRLLTELQDSLARQPRPSVWHAALGKPDLQQLHKKNAAQRYLVYTTEKHQKALQAQRLELGQRQQTLENYGHTISSSIDQLKDRSESLIERRINLERQLTVLSSEIVQKQDRVERLVQRSEQLKGDPASLQFAKLQKRLPDPVQGTLFKQFAEPKAKGLLKWEGILITAPLGQSFTAVSDGLVVFADEIQGLGNVAIVDHGEGYMSLYGMAELLLVQTDQLLLAGDPIGTVGESVGTGTSALYFEVRHNADTLNPTDWLQMKQISQKNEQLRLLLESK